MLKMLAYGCGPRRGLEEQAGAAVDVDDVAALVDDHRGRHQLAQQDPLGVLLQDRLGAGGRSPLRRAAGEGRADVTEAGNSAT